MFSNIVSENIFQPLTLSSLLLEFSWMLGLLYGPTDLWDSVHLLKMYLFSLPRTIDSSHSRGRGGKASPVCTSPFQYHVQDTFAHIPSVEASHMSRLYSVMVTAEQYAPIHSKRSLRRYTAKSTAMGVGEEWIKWRRLPPQVTLPFTFRWLLRLSPSTEVPQIQQNWSICVFSFLCSGQYWRLQLKTHAFL